MPVDLTGLPPATEPAQFEEWAAKRIPADSTVRDGVVSVSIPFRVNPMRMTYSYLLTGPDGILVVDPGWDSDEGWDLLSSAITRAGLDPDSVYGIVVTHFHPDHLAMAARARDRTGAWVGLHRADLEMVGRLADRERSRAAQQDWLRWAGVPHQEVAAYRQRERLLDLAPPLTGPFRELSDGEEFATSAGTARLMHTPGHTPGHLCVVLDQAGLLLSGDHILPKISPTMGFGADRNGDPLGDYLESLRRCGDLGDLEVAPAHEYRFRGLPERAKALIDEHHERLAEVAAATRSGASTVWQVAERIRWRREWAGLDPMNRFIALSETECYLSHLGRHGRIDWRPFLTTQPI